MTDIDPDFSDLRALFINCTLKRSPEISHTEGLIRISSAIMERHGVGVEVVRAVDHDIATGVWPDMREHGWPSDDWPAIFEQVLAADILVLAGPIHRDVGQQCAKVIRKNKRTCIGWIYLTPSTLVTWAEIALSVISRSRGNARFFLLSLPWTLAPVR